MKCLVTGTAGFIGSHLCEHLLQAGHTVVGLDAFIPFYPRAVKEANLAGFRSHPAFRFHPLDLRSDPLDDVLADVEAVFHIAGMPGLTRSWTDFDMYESCNITATQRLLEAVRRLPNVRRFICASTSSVYGRYGFGDETVPTRPISPYGVTKLAAENLCRATPTSAVYRLSSCVTSPSTGRDSGPTWAIIASSTRCSRLNPSSSTATACKPAAIPMSRIV